MTVSQPRNDSDGLPEETNPAPTPTPDFQPVSSIPAIPLQPDAVSQATIEPTSRPKLSKAEKLEQQRVRMAVARDDPAFTAFHEKNKQGLYSFILKFTRNIQDAEDILNETFEAASLEWHKIGTLEEKPRRSWLYTTAKRKATDHYRRLDARNRLLTRLAEEHRDQERLKDSPNNERIWLPLGKLSKQERASLDLLSKGFSINEIAGVLKVKESSVRSYLTRGREKYIQAAEEMEAASKRNAK